MLVGDCFGAKCAPRNDTGEALRVLHDETGFRVSPVKAYISIKYHNDNANQDTIDRISSALVKSGFETVCIARDIEKWGQVKVDVRELMRKTFEEIESSDVVVVELTEKGVGVGIEAGYAHAKGIPVVTIARRGADISVTLRGISDTVLRYEHFDELERLFAQLQP